MSNRIWLFVLLLLLWPTGLALAKGPAAKVTITGPNLREEIEVTHSTVLEALSLAQFEEFSQSIEAPEGLGTGYELTRYFKDGSRLWAFDHLHYYPDPAGGPGYVFYDGLLEGGWSEYDGKWFQVSATGETALQRLLAEEGVAIEAEAPAESLLLPVTGGTTWPLAGLAVAMGGLLLVGGLFLCSYRASSKKIIE
jgi:hypothetical protein